MLHKCNGGGVVDVTKIQRGRIGGCYKIAAGEGQGGGYVATLLEASRTVTLLPAKVLVDGG